MVFLECGILSEKVVNSVFGRFMVKTGDFGSFQCDFLGIFSDIRKNHPVHDFRDNAVVYQKA